VSFQDFVVNEAIRHGVSKAELEALSLAVEGNETNAIANQLGISPEAVRQRLSQVYQKFQIKGNGRAKLTKLVQLLMTHYQEHQVLSDSDASSNVISPGGESVSPCPHIDLSQAPDISAGFFGRTQELDKLKHWITQERCRLVAILGISKIGKTFLAAKLANKLKDKFDFIIWRSLRHAPKALEILANLIESLCRSPVTTLPDTLDERIAQLIEYLCHHSCLIILDGVESILQEGKLAGQYQEGYEDYDEFFRRIGEIKHPSCFIITSLENPKRITLLEGETLPVRSLMLSGFQAKDKDREAREFLKMQQLVEVEENSLQKLIDRYQSHPAALKIVGKIIRDLFNGNIAEFLSKKTWLFSDVDNLIEPSFSRLSNLEKEFIYWLAVEHEPVSFSKIQTSIPLSVSQRELLEALASLEQRSLIETTTEDGKSLFSLQLMVKEYVENQLIKQISSTESTGESLRRQLQPPEELIELTPSAKKTTHLSEWFGNNFEPDWQPLEFFLGAEQKKLSPRLRSTFHLKDEGSVKRFKKIELGTSPDRQVVALLVALTEETNNKVGIRVQVHPLGEEAYLPINLRLVLLNDSEETLREVKAQGEVNFIQLPRFKGELGERFSIQVALNTISLIEDFVI
jgi:DNA-binding CsgD family transcriptional regulator